MKKGTKIIIFLVLFGIGWLVYWAFRTIANLKKINFAVGRVRLSDKDKAEAQAIIETVTEESSELELLLEGGQKILKALAKISLEVEVKANNFSGQEFKVTQVYAELRNKATGAIIARIEEPMPNPVKLAENRITSIWLPIQINGFNAIAIAPEFLGEILKAITGKGADLSELVEISGFVRSGLFSANFTK